MKEEIVVGCVLAGDVLLWLQRGCSFWRSRGFAIIRCWTAGF